MNYQENEKTKFILEKILKKLERLNINDQNLQQGNRVRMNLERYNHNQVNKTFK